MFFVPTRVLTKMMKKNRDKKFDKSKKTYAFPMIIFEGLAEKGIDVGKMLVSLGIDPIIAVNPEVYVTKKEYDDIFSYTFKAVDDPVFWIQFAKEIKPQSAGILGYTAMACENLGAAFEKIARYKEVCSGSRMVVRRQDMETVISYHIFEDDCFYSTYLIEIGIISLIFIGRWLTKKEFAAARVNFKFSEPFYTSEYKPIFNAPVFFQQPQNEIIFKNDVLDYKIDTADKNLLQTFTDYANGILDKLNESTHITDGVKNTVRDLLKGESPSIEKTARKLGMSRRTLQRRLQEEGTTYHAILEEERKSMAMSYVGKSQLNISEIAYLIGFLDLSSFYRAFKRWTGAAPQAYRDEYIR